MNNKWLKSEILSSHNNVPYHNYSHAKRVSNTMMLLENSQNISPGRMAWYLHDAGHTGIANSPHDEIHSCKIAHDILTSRGYKKDYIDTVKELIMATVFSERWNIYKHDSMLLADADLSNIWRPYQAFIRNSIGMLLESTKNTWPLSDNDIIKNFTIDTPLFFKKLTNITWKPENPFLTKKAQILFPHFPENKDILSEEIEKNPQGIITLVRKIENTSKIENWKEKL